MADIIRGRNGVRDRACLDRPVCAASFDEFDDAVRQFLKALELAGVALPSDPIDSVVDLLKKRP